MASLHLDSLDIRNYRAFKHLVLDKLGRVNLIVGKNNVGKTALLEAVWVYLDHLFLYDLVGLLQRSRLHEQTDNGIRLDDDLWRKTLQELFHGRPDLSASTDPITIGPRDDPQRRLTIQYRTETGFMPPAGRHLEVLFGKGTPERIWLEQREQERPGSRKARSVPYRFVSSNGLSDADIARYWDEIALTEWETTVINALRIIAPDVRRISLVSFNAVRFAFSGDAVTFQLPGGGKARIPYVKTDFPAPISLRTMGEGMNRMLGLVLALVNARDGILLIDEIENGLHYSVQPDLWRLIFETADQLNVQVFATTHSLDCLRAFEQAASEREEEKSLLVSLRRHLDDPEQTIAVLAGRGELATIVQSHIEVR